MNFDLTKKGKAFLAEIEELCSIEGPKRSAEGLEADVSAFRRALTGWAEKLGASGYLQAGVEGDATLLDVLAAQQALAAFNTSLFVSLEFSARVFGRLIAYYGTPEMQGDVLTSLFSGRRIGAVSLVNPFDNQDELSEKLEITKRGRELHLVGTLDAVVNAKLADWMIVEGKVEQEYYLFLVQSNHENCIAYEDKEFSCSNPFRISKVQLKHCRVTPERVLGPYEDKTPFRNLNLWRDQVLALAAVGLMKSSFDEALKYSKANTTKGNALIKKQEIGFKLAEMWTLLDTAQLLCQRASWMIERGEKEASTLTFCAKAFSCASAEEVASKAVEILGVEGLSRGHSAEQSYRNAKILQVSGTSTEKSRLKIGSELLLHSQ